MTLKSEWLTQRNYMLKNINDLLSEYEALVLKHRLEIKSINKVIKECRSKIKKLEAEIQEK